MWEISPQSQTTFFCSDETILGQQAAGPSTLSIVVGVGLSHPNGAEELEEV
jgi:hypothetical protein